MEIFTQGHTFSERLLTNWWYKLELQRPTRHTPPQGTRVQSFHSRLNSGQQLCTAIHFWNQLQKGRSSDALLSASCPPAPYPGLLSHQAALRRHILATQSCRDQPHQDEAAYWQGPISGLTPNVLSQMCLFYHDLWGIHMHINVGKSLVHPPHSTLK